MLETLLAAEVLVIGILQPARAQRPIRQVVHVLQYEQPGQQPRRQGRLPQTGLTHLAEAAAEEVPVDLLPQPRQRRAKIDDLIPRQPKEALLPSIAQLVHPSSPMPKADLKGITDRPNRESPIQRKQAPSPGPPAKSSTSSAQLRQEQQSLQYPSRATLEDKCMNPNNDLL